MKTSSLGYIDLKKSMSRPETLHQGEHTYKTLRFTHRKSVDPHHCLSKAVFPIPLPGIQLPSEIKTYLERGDIRS